MVFQLVKMKDCSGWKLRNKRGSDSSCKRTRTGHTIVTILCDSGSRYLSRLFNFDYLTSKGLEVPDWLNSKKLL